MPVQFKTGPHQTVLLQEAVDALVTDTRGIYVDATFGRGGHSAAILGKLGRDGKLIALDKDPEAIGVAQQRFGGDSRFSVYHTSFSGLAALAQQLQLAGRIDGILLDLGVSSPQLDDAVRGFSFTQDGPLDMRMNPQAGISAREWIATATAEAMADVFRKYGEERYAKRIAGAIVREREKQPITTTAQLAKIVSEANPAWEKHKHPATRVFQAIRIHINQELDDLQVLLRDVLDLLRIGGRLVVISFHSLEDRLVKNFMRDQARGYSAGERLPARLPVQFEQSRVRMELLGKPVYPPESEIGHNPRARSAVMRVAGRIA